MKALLCCIGIVAFVEPAIADTIVARDAHLYVGQSVAIIGAASIDRVRERPSIFIGIDGFGPDSPLSAIIPPDVARTFNFNSFDGRTVQIKGQVELNPGGQPQIVIKSSDQITFADPPANSTACFNSGYKITPIPATHRNPTRPAHSFGGVGATVVGVVFADDGSVLQAGVKETSGDSDYDQAAIDEVKSEWRWQPLLPACQGGVAKTYVFIKWN